MSGGISVLRPEGSVQLVPMWGAPCWLSGGRVFLGAGERGHLQAPRPAPGDLWLHRHPGGDGESTLSRHL